MATSALKTLFIIIERSKADKLTETLASCGVNYQHEVFALGTARTGLLEIIGIGETEKMLVIGTIRAEQVDIVRNVLNQNFGFDKPGAGIAFTIPISAVGGEASMFILAGGQLQKKEEHPKKTRRKK